MKLHEQHPRDQLVSIMNRIYHSGMTTLSGGNLSIRDEDGNLWITPAGIDKGSLTPADISCVQPDGIVTGPHRPSSEYPFHLAIYAARPDIKAIAHAHSPALVSFSIARVVPDVRVLPEIEGICGPVGYAPYALTGSEALGRVIAATFAAGHHIILLENHGGVAGGRDLVDAFQRLEALEFCGRILIRAKTISQTTAPSGKDRLLDSLRPDEFNELAGPAPSESDTIARTELAAMTRRAYERQLILSAMGEVSARTAGQRFLITPHMVDHRHLTLDDMVGIVGGRKEPGKQPGRWAQLHCAIYEQQPEIGAIILAQPANATAYAITPEQFDTRTIPESYILLRDIIRVPFPTNREAKEAIAAAVSPNTPVVLIDNLGVLVTGKNLLQAFDRLEVAEYSARALIESQAIGPLQPIGAAELAELRTVFKLG